MNTPNKLTVLRMILVPLFVCFLLFDWMPGHYLYALFVFAAASTTDYFDGMLARKNNLVTDFGKFLDPLADKILVFAGLVVFVELGLASSIVAIVLLTREFLVTAIRLVAAAGGKVIAASFSAKMKTVSQMVALIAILLMQQFVQWNTFPGFTVEAAAVVGEILLWISAVFAVVSGVEYIWANRSYIKQTK